jgi:hypothetical protein
MVNQDKIRQLSTYYIAIGLVFFIVILCVGNGYVTFVLSTIYILTGIVLINISDGYVKFLSRNEKSDPLGIALGFFWIVALVFYNSLTKYELLSYNNLWPAAGIFALVMFLLLIAKGINKAAGFIIGQIAAILIVSALWGFGTAVVANCIFDGSAPQKYSTTVADRFTKTGRGVGHYLILGAWKPGQDAKTVYVNSKEYLKAKIGTRVTVIQKQGLFHAAWITYSIDTTPPVPAGSGSESSPVPR